MSQNPPPRRDRRTPPPHRPGHSKGSAGRHRKPARQSLAPGIAARNCVLDLLHQVLEEGKQVDELLEQERGFLSLSPRDRAFAFRLLMGTLRQIGVIDAVIGQCLERPKDLRQRDLILLLRLSAAQLLFLDTPAHAAVDTALKLAEARKLGRAKGLVNAVLRRIIRERETLLDGLDRARLNTPDWLWQRWDEHYGAATASAMASAHQQEPWLDLTLRDAGEAEALTEPLEATRLPTGSLRRATGGDITRLAGFAEGKWWVQDAAAALPARLFGPDIRGWRIADLCAAPGGKTAQLLAAGAEVTALDRSAGRLERLNANMQRLGLTPAASIAADAIKWRPAQPLDGVLLDAPCTATGTIRRHPDVAWLKSFEDLDALSEQQAELLTAAIDMVRPGGRIVYCTCSLEPEEGESQIERLRALGAPVRLLPINAVALGLDRTMVTEEGWLRLLPSHWPDHGGLDGFFAACLERLPDSD